MYVHISARIILNKSRTFIHTFTYYKHHTLIHAFMYCTDMHHMYIPYMGRTGSIRHEARIISNKTYIHAYMHSYTHTYTHTFTYLTSAVQVRYKMKQE